MTEKFNLLHEPWLRCIRTDGTPDELGLFSLLEQSHTIKELIFESPLMFAPIHRLLLAVLHRIFGPRNFNEWKDLWRAGKWDALKIKAYFESEVCKDRFNLFDDERPFFQHPKVSNKTGSDTALLPIETLMQEKSAGNNATLFDHTFAGKITPYPPALVARYLIARQAYSLGGGNSFPFNLSDGPLVKGMTSLAISDKNLFETLALNLLVYRGDKPLPGQQDDDGRWLDRPIWEADQPPTATVAEKDGTVPLGYLDYLTWSSKRIKLILDTETGMVSKCHLAQNFKANVANLFDPLKIYATGKKGLYPLQADPDKALWRNSHTIFRQLSFGDEISSLSKHLAAVSRAVSAGEISGRRKYSLQVTGTVNDQASVEFWVHEALPIPLDYFDDESLVTQLESAIGFAEETGKNLSQCLYSLALKLAPKPEDAQKLAKNFKTLPYYWSKLEMEFGRLLIGLPREAEGSMRRWFVSVREIANGAFDMISRDLITAGRELQAVVEAKQQYDKKHGRLKRASVFAAYLSK